VRGAERVELAELVRVVADESLRQRLVATQWRAVSGLTNFIGDLLADRDQVAEQLGRFDGHRRQRLSNHQVSHGVWFRGLRGRILPCKRGCTAPWPVRGVRLGS